MNRRRWMAVLPALALAARAGAQAARDPLAGLTPEQRRAVQAFLKGKSRPGEGDAAADDAIAADLDGDGKPELTVRWTFFGPTFAYSGLAVFSAAAGSWRLAGESPLTGIVDRMSLEGRVIRVDAKTLGKNDPRCCPTKAIVERFRWAGGKLAKG